MSGRVTLVFTTSSHWLSRTIRALTVSDVSHVAVGTEMFGVPVLFHAALDSKTGQDGVQVTPRSRWLEDNIVVAEYEFVNDVSDKMGEMVGLIGEKYDKLGLVGYIAVLLAKWLGERIKNPLSSPRRFVCPRYALKLDPTGDKVPEWKGLDADHVTPHDLLVLCRSSVGFKVLSDVPDRS